MHNGYINEVWIKFINEELVFKYDGRTFHGKLQGNDKIFTNEGSHETLIIHKPTTQDVLEEKGNFDLGSSRELVLEAQLFEALKRGIAHASKL